MVALEPRGTTKAPTPATDALRALEWPPCVAALTTEAVPEWRRTSSGFMRSVRAGL
jgi:hypothetical protein